MTTLQRGTTLIEVLISVAVFSIITGIVLFGFMDSKKVQDLRAASNQLVADLRQIQTLALANQPFAVCSTTGSGTSFGSPCTGTIDSVCDAGTANNCGLVPAGGYGISVSTTCPTSPCSYDMYGDIADGTVGAIGIGIPGAPDGQHSVGPPADPILRTVKLPPKISIVSIKVKVANNPIELSASTFSVNVIPPKPTTSFNVDGVTTGVRVSFCLEHQQNNLHRLVEMVAASGQVTDKVVPNCS